MPLVAEDPLARDVGAICRITAVPTILRVVAELTGLRFAAVARVTRERWMACAVYDQVAFGLTSGGELDVSTTLCGQVLETCRPIIIEHASQDPVYRDHPTPRMHGFEAYLSVPITLSDGHYFGTLCALDPRPTRIDRESVLTQITLFAEMIALAYESDQRTQETLLAKARLESFVMGAPAGIAVFKGPELVFELANARYRSYVDDRPLVGLPAAVALPELQTSGMWDKLLRVYQTGQPHFEPGYTAEAHKLAGAPSGVQAKLNYPPRDQLYLDWIAQPTKDQDGNVDGVMVFVTDVTSKVLARQALERKNRELDNFAYVASHDLKGPLRGIGNLAQWLEDELADKLTDETRSHLDLMRRRVVHMHSLIDAILRYARADGEQATAEFDVAEVVKEVVELVELPPTARVEIEPLPTVLTSRVALQQVFLNLVTNAIKHSRRDDLHLRISARDVGPRWLFAVTDNGPGIAPEHRERIWKLFQALSPSTREANTGIGLAVVKKLVEARHGEVGVESAPGEGATFIFTWPKAESHKEP